MLQLQELGHPRNPHKAKMHPEECQDVQPVIKEDPLQRLHKTKKHPKYKPALVLPNA